MHGDEFTCLGTKENLVWYEQQMGQAFEIKVRGHIGEGDDCDKEILVLNRIVRLDETGLFL